MSNIIDFNSRKPMKTPDCDTVDTWGFDQPLQPTSMTYSFDESPILFVDLPDIKFTIDSFDLSKIEHNEKLDAVHDASFDVCYFCEENPEIASYAEQKLRELHKALIFYKNNIKNG